MAVAIALAPVYGANAEQLAREIRNTNTRHERRNGGV